MTYENEFEKILEFQGMYKNNYSALYLTEGQIDILIEYVHELRRQTNKLQEKLDAKILLINKGDEEQRYAEQEKIIELENRVQELESENKNLDFNLTTTLRNNHEHRLRTAHYCEAIEKAIEEEERNLEGYQSTVHKILTEALEGGKNDG